MLDKIKKMDIVAENDRYMIRNLVKEDKEIFLKIAQDVSFLNDISIISDVMWKTAICDNSTISLALRSFIQNWEAPFRKRTLQICISWLAFWKRAIKNLELVSRKNHFHGKPFWLLCDSFSLFRDDRV